VNPSLPMIRRHFSLCILCPLWWTVLFSANAAGVDVLPAPSGNDVDYSKVQAIFDARCLECHIGADSPLGLDLSTFRSYSRLVDEASQLVPSLKRVKSGDAKNSFLFQKLNSHTPKAGKRMPIGSVLSLEDQALVRDWIDQGARPANRRPIIASGPAASASPAQVGHAIQFVVTATDPNADAMTYAWNFGDGTTRAGATALHVFTAPGIYEVRISISDARDVPTVGLLSLQVDPDIDSDGDGSGNSADVDDDNDGVPDGVETVLNFSSLESTAAPEVSGTQSLPALSLKGKIDFVKPSADSISVRGKLTAAVPISAANQLCVIEIAGVSRALQLGAKGSTTKGTVDALKIVPNKSGAVFSLSLTGAEFKLALLGETVLQESDIKRVPCQTTLWVLLGKVLYRADLQLEYSRVRNRGGSVVNARP